MDDQLASGSTPASPLLLDPKEQRSAAKRNTIAVSAAIVTVTARSVVHILGELRDRDGDQAVVLAYEAGLVRSGRGLTPALPVEPNGSDLGPAARDGVRLAPVTVQTVVTTTRTGD